MYTILNNAGLTHFLFGRRGYCQCDTTALLLVSVAMSKQFHRKTKIKNVFEIITFNKNNLLVGLFLVINTAVLPQALSGHFSASCTTLRAKRK